MVALTKWNSECIEFMVNGSIKTSEVIAQINLKDYVSFENVQIDQLKIV